MKPIEIIVILAIVLFFSFLIGRHIYRKKKNLPTGECACCSTNKKKSLVNQYHKKYKKD